MINVITFTDGRMETSAQKCTDSALKMGADQYMIYRPVMLPTWFNEHHKEVLKHERGFGFYCWKPFFVSKAIQEMDDGEYLVWADAGQTFVGPLQSVVNSMNNDVMLFSNGWPTSDWCKMDVLDAIIPVYKTELDYTKCPQTQASIIFFKVSEWSKMFCREWLAWSLMPGLIDNEPSKLENYPTFAEHRWDQAILGAMQIKYSIPLHWFPSTYAFHIKSEYPNDIYPAIVEHHRKRDPGKGGGNPEW